MAVRPSPVGTARMARASSPPQIPRAYASRNDAASVVVVVLDEAEAQWTKTRKESMVMDGERGTDVVKDGIGGPTGVALLPPSFLRGR